MNVFEEIKLLVKLNAQYKILQREFGMKLSVNMVIQIMGTIIQVLNIISPVMTSVKSKALVACIMACIQAIVAYLGHYSNPDGTPAALPYSADSLKKQ